MNEPLNKYTPSYGDTNIEINQTPALKIQEMRLRELRTAMEWARDEGWNPGVHDYQAYHQQDPTGFLALHLNNELIGSISIVKHTHNFAFIGLFIILPEHRKKGYGKMLWNEALNRLNAFSSIGLYSVPMQKSRYEQSGFFSHYPVSRLEMSNFPGCTHTNSSISEIEDETMLNKLIEHDEMMWGSSRKNLLRSLLSPAKFSVYSCVSFDEEGQINGYGVVRPCEEGYRVGPLYTNSFESAKELTQQLLSHLKPDSKIIFDVPERNNFSQAFAEYFRLNLIPEACTEAMFKGEETNTNSDECYGLLSLELG